MRFLTKPRTESVLAHFVVRRQKIAYTSTIRPVAALARKAVTLYWVSMLLEQLSQTVLPLLR